MDTVEEPSRLPLLVVIALVVLAAFAGVVWLAYTQGVERGRESVSRELVAQEFWKVRKPAAPAYTGLKIYEQPSIADQNPSAGAAASGKPRLANVIPALRPTASAAPEGPARTPAVAPSQAGVTSRSANERAGLRPAETASPTQAGEPTIKPGAAVPGTATPPPAQRIATRAPTPLTKSEVPAMSTHPLTEPNSFSSGSAAALSGPPPRSAAVPAKPSAPPAPAAPKRPVSASAASVTPSTPPAPRPVVGAATLATKPAPAATAGVMLQIGSYKSQAEATQSWQAFRSSHDAAANYRPDVKQVELGAKGTWYRLRMGPFPDRTSALETCRKLKADGASCLLAQ